MRVASGRAGLAFVLAVGVLASCSSGGGHSAAKVPASLTAALASVAPVTDLNATSDHQTDVLLDEAGLRAELGANADRVYALLDKARDKSVGAQRQPDMTELARTRAYESKRAHAQLLAAGASLSTVL